MNRRSMDSAEIPTLPGHPTLIHFGAGIVNGLGASLPAGARVLAVTSTGTRRRAHALFTTLANQVDLTFAERIPTETALDAVSTLVTAERGRESDLVLAVGGGATMDAAKALAISLRTQAPFSAILSEPDAFAERALPIVCVPTTSGSGSDVTPYATIWDLAADRKRSLSHRALYPSDSWIDPKLTTSLPPSATATSGLDALSHAMESIWSRHHLPLTDEFAGTAIRLIVEYLPVAVSSPGDLAARTEMARAALIAGLAISRTQTAAAHAGSYRLTLRHRVPHGHACALSLPWLLRWHGNTCPERINILTAALGVPDAEAAARSVESLIARVGLPTRLRDLGISNTDLPAIVEAAISSDRMSNTIGTLTTDKVNDMFQAIW